jgi:hypothetical protein
VPETGYRCSTGSIDVLLAGAVEDIDAITLHGERQIGLAVTRKYVAHGSPVFALLAYPMGFQVAAVCMVPAF